MRKTVRSKEELREAARTILAELDKTALKRSGLDGGEAGTPEETAFPAIDVEEMEQRVLEQQDMLEKLSRQKRYRAKMEMRDTPSLASAEQSAPQAKKKQLLEQRLERREGRAAAAGTDGGADEAGGDIMVTDVRRDELTEDGLPFRLSEVYRRDARRYDGTFERY